MNSISLPAAGERTPVSELILHLANELADRAELIQSRIEGKLSRVMVAPIPTVLPGKILPKEELEKGREYPPLFSDLQDRLNIIRNAFNDIDDALSRTEL